MWAVAGGGVGANSLGESTMRVLILDDDEQRHAGFRAAMVGVERVHVRNYEEAVKALSGSWFDVAYLDHDLSDRQAVGQFLGDPSMFGGEMTGADVARHIAAMDRDARPGCVVIHSWNPDGARRMATILREAGVRAQIAPYGRGAVP